MSRRLHYQIGATGFFVAAFAFLATDKIALGAMFFALAVALFVVSRRAIGENGNG